MLFNSFEFALFFVIVTFLYFALPYRWRWALLLGASCFFYMFFIPIYILILFFTILIDYFAGIYLEKTVGTKRKNLLALSILANIGILAVFKYYNFFVENLHPFISPDYLPILKIALPVGLSFHTFQAMSYTIEVYRGKQKAEKHFGIYALYVMFYPQLVAGPIERPQNVLHQFYERHDFDYQRVTDGLKLMAWGLFKKIVIADRLAVLVDEVYSKPEAYNGEMLLIATLFFTFQIYCDFSGYSDIALGSAKVMGFRLMQNFRSPYLATDIADFWKRWHISLSTWFRDYVYIPLGGNRKNVYLNILIVFTISGFWHGANWNFLIWGFLHGLFLILFQLKQKYLPFFTLPRIVSIPITFVVVSFAWIFFRADGIQDAWYIVSHLLDNVHGQNYIDSVLFSKLDWLLSLTLLPFLWLTDSIENNKGLINALNYRPVWFRWAIYYALVLAILFLSKMNDIEFIYFQF